MELDKNALFCLVRMIKTPEEEWAAEKIYQPKDALARRDLAQLERFVDNRILGSEKAVAPFNLRDALTAALACPDGEMEVALAEMLKRIKTGRAAQPGDFKLKAVLRDRLKMILHHYTELQEKGCAPKTLRALHLFSLEMALAGTPMADDFEGD